MPTELHGQVRTAVQAVLWNASNYPANVQARMLGQDVSPLTAKVTDAILPLIAKAVAAERERCARIAEADDTWEGDNIAALIRGEQVDGAN